jgi:preprotein translocase subunit SecY
MHDTFTLLSSFLSLLLKKNDCVRKALQIVPCGVQGRLLFIFTIIVINILLLVVFVVAVTIAVVTVGDRRKKRGQFFGPNNYLPLLLAMSAL